MKSHESGRRKPFTRIRVITIMAVFLQLASFPASLAAQDKPLAVLSADMAAKTTPVSPVLYGAFFEDINHGADGGVYAELVQNRSFEGDPSTGSWEVVKASPASKGRIKPGRKEPINASNPTYGEMKAVEAGTGVANKGYGGIVLSAGKTYTGSVYLRSADSSVSSFTIALDQGDKKDIATASVTGIGPAWKRFEFSFLPATGTRKGRIKVMPDQAGSFSVDMLSLFPKDTFKGRPNGLRADLAGLVDGMNPGFFRFPGGCVVEGKSPDKAYRWKDTIGPIERRKANENVWGYEQSYGLGFHEYFQYCEDMGSEPVPIINCGMACQARNGAAVMMQDLGPWIQDALDLIEYANGPETSTWGAKRAANGHPAPFNLKYLGVGNEQWGLEYYERYRAFSKALRAKYPSIKLIFAAGPVPAGTMFDDAWEKAKAYKADVVDEHYYCPPEWFLTNNRRYDSYDRSGPKVFVGEFAAHVASRENTLFAALAEAAYMTGLERNGDVVEMAAYAPLFAREGEFQWNPDLIWFDNDRVVGTPSYWVQRLFGQNKSDATVPSKLELDPSQRKKNVLGGGIGLGSWASSVEYRDIAVSDKSGKKAWSAGTPSDLTGWTPQGGSWTARGGSIVQSSESPDCRLLLDGPSWDESTLSLKARKNSGNEGFLVLFGRRGGDYYWWNLGGWNNTTTCIEKGAASARSMIGKGSTVSIETGRWYDIKIELSGDTIKCYLDGQLIHELVDQQDFDPVYAHVGTTTDGTIVVKIVNVATSPSAVRIKLANAGALKPKATATILTGAGRDSINSLAKPEQVIPKEKEIDVSADFTYRADANSVTIIRMKK